VSDPTPVTPKPSATVVPLRDGPEVLLVQRAKRDGTPGIWALPGGKVEPVDGAVEGASEADTIEIARRAGARETHEEAGLHRLATGFMNNPG
jgi:8-oxo-dGTP pyrophosphatase MutT (NUDIX family)